MLLDLFINNKITAFQTESLTPFIIFITEIISPIKLLFLSFLLLAFLAYKKRYQDIFFVSIAIIGAVVFFSLLIYLFGKNIKNTFIRWSFIAGNIFLILLIGYTRIYLNAHWFTDVIAGFALGLLWFSFVIILWKK